MNVESERGQDEVPHPNFKYTPLPFPPLLSPLGSIFLRSFNIAAPPTTKLKNPVSINLLLCPPSVPPPPQKKAILAGRSISELQTPAVSAGAVAPPLQQHQRQRQRGVGGSTGAAPNGGRPRLAAHGEKMAGPPRLAANGEKVAGFAGRKTGPLSAGVGASVSVPAKGGGKHEEAWRKAEDALKQKEQAVRNALKEKQRTLLQVTFIFIFISIKGGHVKKKKSSIVCWLF